MTDPRPGSLGAAEKLLAEGQLDLAVAEYTRLADQLDAEGFFPKAAALYKKILKIAPKDENAMWHLANIAARQGLMRDARELLSTLSELRLEHGDLTGDSQVRARLAELDQAEVEVRVAGAQARADVGDADSAVQRLKAAAADLQAKGKHSDALQLLTEAAMLDPADAALRQALVGAYIAGGDFDSACQFATTAGEFRRIADVLFGARRDDEGTNVLAMAVEIDPADGSVRAELARRLAERGDFDGARGALAADGNSPDSDMLWTGAHIDVREGRLTEGLAMFERLLAGEPERRADLAALGCALAERDPEAAFACVDAAARAAIAADEWEGAAAVLSELAVSLPGHIPALLRLVEICVDGGLDREMRDAQERLVDAYLADGAGREAKVIAEDLVSQDPSHPANVERLRRAQVLLGETVSVPAPIETMDPPARDALRGAGPPSLNGFGAPGDGRSAPLPIEAVLQTLRDDVVHDTSPETAEQHFKLAAAYMEIGMRNEALGALEVAARSPVHRFRAASMLGKAFLDSGDGASALEWYGRAAEAPAPSDDARRALLYDVALLLEAQSEKERALAVLLEIQADAGNYRDVADRLEQLKVLIGR